MNLVSKQSLNSMIDQVQEFFAAADLLKLSDAAINDLILKRQEEANKDSDLIEQIVFKMCEHEQISREMSRES